VLEAESRVKSFEAMLVLLLQLKTCGCSCLSLASVEQIPVHEQWLLLLGALCWVITNNI